MLNFFLEDGCFATQPTDISFKVTRRHDNTLCGNVFFLHSSLLSTLPPQTLSSIPFLFFSDYGPPCHVYLTFGDQMATAMIVNFQIRRRVKEGVVYFDTHPRNGEIEDYRFRVTSDPDKFIYMDIEEDRFVYWIELHGLEPDTKYYFITGGVPDDPGNDEGEGILFFLFLLLFLSCSSLVRLFSLFYFFSLSFSLPFFVLSISFVKTSCRQERGGSRTSVGSRLVQSKNPSSLYPEVIWALLMPQKRYHSSFPSRFLSFIIFILLTLVRVLFLFLLSFCLFSPSLKRLHHPMILSSSQSEVTSPMQTHSQRVIVVGLTGWTSG
jgi:hypothetical protein